MYLNYYWKDMEVNRVVYSNSNLPHTKAFVEDVSYEFEVNIKVEDIVAYIMPLDLKLNRHKNHESVVEYGFAKLYITKTVKYFEEQGFDLEELENDDDFVDFMKDRYEEQALESWQATNDIL